METEIEGSSGQETVTFHLTPQAMDFWDRLKRRGKFQDNEAAFSSMFTLTERALDDALNGSELFIRNSELKRILGL